MAAKALTWRVTDIPEGTSEQDVLKFFEPKDQDRITVCSLCPDVYGGDSLTATVLFRPHREQPDLGPKLSFHKPPDMEVDKDFEGFTPLYCPQKGIHIAADIIAITGLAGHAFGSWAHSEEKMWLRDYLPKAYAHNARVLTYGYNSHITGDNTSMATLGDLSNSFSDNLINMRDSTKCDQRPIIFIGHSLGCMLIKKSMTSVRIRNVDSSRLPVRALIFLAAPHRGMNVDVLRTVVKNDPPRHLIEELSPDSPTLKEINEAFMEISRDIDILTCFETKKTKTLVKDVDTDVYTRSGEAILMLPQSSATGYWPKEKSVHANANHSNIAKLKKGGGSIFLNVGSAIKRALAPTAQNFFADPQNIGDVDWKDQRTGRHHHVATGPPGDSETPDRTMYTDQSHSDNPSPHSGSHPSSSVRDPRTPTRAAYTREAHSMYAPVDESEVNDTEMNSSGGSPYAPDNSQSPQTRPRNPPMTRSYCYTAGHDSESHHPMSQNMSPEPTHFAPSGGPGSQNVQAQHPPTPPPPYNNPMSPGQFSANQFPGEERQSNGNGAQGTQALSDDQTTRHMFEHMTLGSDNNVLGLQQKTEHEEAAGGSSSHAPEDSAGGRHPDVYCDECDEEIVGVRYQCLECPSWDYCSHCYQVALHPKHEFEAIDPPGVNDSDNSTDADEDISDDEDERVGVAKCAHCQADVVSPNYFYQCPKCSNLELACQGCQRSPTCINHGERVEVRQFIWYGRQLSSNVWINDEPTPHDSALVQALKTQDMDKLDLLARSQQLVNAAVDQAGRTALHIAAHLRLQVCAKFLLMRGANPDLGDKSFCTPLSQAILSKNEDMAFLLLDRGASPNSPDIRGNTPLHLASIAGCIDLAQDFVTNFPALVDKRNKAGETALFRACQVGNFGNARILLNAGADANMTNDNGSTQLGELAASNQGQSVKFLLNAGAEADRLDGFARTPLYRAAENGHFELCNILMQHGANPNVWANGGGSTPLGEAASNGRLKTIGVLIDGGADIEGRDNRNRTPLFRAAADQKPEVCRILLDRDASPNPGLALPDESDEECQWGMTPLQIASFFDLDDVAEVLIEYEVLLEEPDDRGRTALFLAAERGNADVCQVLLSAGADCNAQADGSSVLAIAAQRGHFEMVQLLLQGGAKAVPPLSVKGQKWKNFVFDPTVMSGRRQDILELLRAHKHR